MFLIGAFGVCVAAVVVAQLHTTTNKIHTARHSRRIHFENDGHMRSTVCIIRKQGAQDTTIYVIVVVAFFFFKTNACSQFTTIRLMVVSGSIVMNMKYLHSRNGIKKKGLNYYY